MNKNFILITGASGSFGVAITHHLLALGYGVVGITSREESALKLKHSVSENYSESFIGLAQDLTETDSSSTIVENVGKLGVDVVGLVNNARSLEFLKLEESGHVSRQNFLNEYLLDVVLPYELSIKLAESNQSSLKSIVNVGSMYGSVAVNPNLYDGVESDGAPIHYGVSKAALAHLSKELAVRLAPKGIRVNCVAFGGKDGRVDDVFRANYQKICPAGKMLEDSDIVGPIEFLLSNKSNAVTGHTLLAEGGWVAC